MSQNLTPRSKCAGHDCQTAEGGDRFDFVLANPPFNVTFRRMEVVKPAREIIARFAKKTDAIFEQVNTLQRQI